MLYLLSGTLIIFSGIFWRMGGAEGYDKLWRRAGSAVCMLVLIPMFYHAVELPWYLFSGVLIFFGCISYFGWINYIVQIWHKIEMDREYWWNFGVENCVIQASVLPYKHSPLNVAWVIISGFTIAFVKVWLDSEDDIFEDLDIGDDILSELWHGSANAFCIFINMLLP